MLELVTNQNALCTHDTILSVRIPQSCWKCMSSPPSSPTCQISTFCHSSSHLIQMYRQCKAVCQFQMTLTANVVGRTFQNEKLPRGVEVRVEWRATHKTQPVQLFISFDKRRWATVFINCSSELKKAVSHVNMLSHLHARS